MLSTQSTKEIKKNSVDEKKLRLNYSIILPHTDFSPIYSRFRRIKSSKSLFNKEKRLSNSSNKNKKPHKSCQNCTKYVTETKNIKCATPKNFLQLPKNNLKLNNSSFLVNQKSKNNIVEEYKMHPFRKLNLQIIQEEIKQKICEMHQKSIMFEEEENNLSIISAFSVGARKLKKTMVEKYGLEENQNKKYNKSNTVKKSKECLNLSFSNMEVNEENKVNTSINGIVFDSIINLNTIQSPKHCKKNNFKNSIIMGGKLTSLIEVKNRNLEKKKNIYDSMEDTESEEEYEQDGKISPTSNLILIFDSFILFFFFYGSFCFPITIAKIKCYCETKENDIFDIFNKYVYFFIDLLFILDCIISFFRGYYSSGYVLIQNQGLIIRNYLENDFFFDLIEAIPFYSLSKYMCLFKEKQTI